MTADTIVVVPVHNEGKFLDQTIRSLICQTYKSFNILVSCNSCTDDSLEIAKKYSAQDARIRVLETSGNLPSFGHWRWIMSQIEDKNRYKFGLSIGGHDIVSPRYVELLVRELTSNSGLSLCYPEEAYAVDGLDRIKFRYPPMPQTYSKSDFFQSIPLILSIRYNILAFGLWRSAYFFDENYRNCYAADHIRIGDISRNGAVKSVHGASILVRDTSRGLETYARKHFGTQDLDLRRGIAEQFSWVDLLSRSLLPTPVPVLNDALRLSALTMYFARYLEQFGGNADKLNLLFREPEISAALSGQARLMKLLEKWIESNCTADKS
jgi:hypothetical protein